MTVILTSRTRRWLVGRSFSKEHERKLHTFTCMSTNGMIKGVVFPKKKCKSIYNAMTSCEVEPRCNFVRVTSCSLKRLVAQDVKTRPSWLLSPRKSAVLTPTPAPHPRIATCTPSRSAALRAVKRGPCAPPPSNHILFLSIRRAFELR